jgi:hypothetical protein
MKLCLSFEVLGQSSLPLFSFHFHMMIPPADENLTSFANHGQPFSDCSIQVVQKSVYLQEKVVVFAGGDQVPKNLL